MSCAKKHRLNRPQSPVSSAPSIYILYDDDIEIDTADVGGADDHGVSGDAFGALLDDC